MSPIYTADIYDHDGDYSQFSEMWQEAQSCAQFLESTQPQAPSALDLDSFFSNNYSDNSSETSDEASTSSSTGHSSISQSPHLSPYFRTCTPSDFGPTLTVAPSDLSRSESPSTPDATPPTTYLPTLPAARQSSVFYNDPDAESDSDDGHKDEDYRPESDSEPAFISTSSRKRRLSFDEYTPEVVKKKPRISGPAKRSTPKNAIKLPSAKLARPGPSAKQTRASPPARNTQVDCTTATRIEKLLGCKKDTIPTWQCPGCPLYQYNHRLPDFKRHMITHLGRVLRCIGVPLSEAERYGIPPDATQIVYLGEVRVGGCDVEFSRPDAFKRHLTNPNNSCVPERKGGRGC